jgi:hypothetical protein
MTHERAIEAACAVLDSHIRHGNVATPHIVGRAVAAFLRAEAGELRASYKERSIGQMLANELTNLADELESPISS